MKSEIIIHNSVSLDGSLTGFMPDMELHYRIAGEYKPDAHLIGSETILSGINLLGEGVPEEVPEDFLVPERGSSLPLWVIVDSGARLHGVLHTCRRFEYCRDLIILVSETTPADYLIHLKERNYKYIITGKVKVDLKMAFEILSVSYGIKKILTDTGRILGNLLLNMELVNEISLLVHPLIVGEKCYPVFSDIHLNLPLKIKKSEQFENGCVWIVYNVGGDPLLK
jgi:2,5-diamino-6-(ribosylamino)-4(3H)-pyrimidinone 5'-phosphate reductase